MTGDLTTLPNAKAYLGVTSSTADTLIQLLITAVSATLLNFCNRASFAVTDYVEVYDGNGKDWLQLRQWPVVSVSSVEFGQLSVPAADTSKFPPSSGFALEPAGSTGAQQRLLLYGHCLPRLRASVRVSYRAGYDTTPPDVELAALQAIAEAYARKDRPGVVSKTLGGQETVSFSQADLGAAIKSALRSYQRVTPG